MNKQLSLSIRFVVSVITVALMVTAAIVVGDKEVIFPETAALTVGAFVSDKLPWRTGMVRMIVVMTLGAFIGYGLSAYSPLPLYVNVIAAFTACIIILSAVRSTMLPMISAAVLPILTNVQSLVYPVSVILLTLAVIEIRLLLLRYGLIEQTEFPDENISGRAEIARRLWLIIVFAILAAAAIFSGMTFIIAPPLAVVFAEAAQKDTPVRKDPFGFFLCTILCTFAGTASRMVLCDLFRVNIVIGAAVSAAAALFFLILFKKPFPPAAALAVLPFILPESVIALYPFQVVTGCAAVISLDMIYQKALDKDTPERAVVGIIDFILSLQILPPKRVYAPADSRVKTEKNVQSDDGEILPPSLDDDNVTAIPAVSGTMTEETAVSENETRIITEKAEEEVPGIPDSIPQSDTVSEIHEETEKKADTAKTVSEDAAENDDTLLPSLLEGEIIAIEPSDDAFSFTLPAMEEKTLPPVLKFEDDEEKASEAPEMSAISSEDKEDKEKKVLPEKRRSIFDKLKSGKKKSGQKNTSSEKQDKTQDTADKDEPDSEPAKPQKNVRRRI